MAAALNRDVRFIGMILVHRDGMSVSVKRILQIYEMNLMQIKREAGVSQWAGGAFNALLPLSCLSCRIPIGVQDQP